MSIVKKIDEHKSHPKNYTSISKPIIEPVIRFFDYIKSYNFIDYIEIFSATRLNNDFIKLDIYPRIVHKQYEIDYIECNLHDIYPEQKVDVKNNYTGHSIIKSDKFIGYELYQNIPNLPQDIKQMLISMNIFYKQIVHRSEFIDPRQFPELQNSIPENTKLLITKTKNGNDAIVEKQTNESNTNLYNNDFLNSMPCNGVQTMELFNSTTKPIIMSDKSIIYYQIIY